MKLVTFRIEVEVWVKAKAKAMKLGRSLSGQIRFLLKEFIKGGN